MANQTAKRYVCASCGSEILVTRGGEGTLVCCGQPMQVRGASPGVQAQLPRPEPEVQRG
ncbi:MAG: hypothetical protein HY690_08260 [Chloroflexi bacterium]|nr:hypothetical protein [Chloroflexota bacterium]